MSIHTEWRLFIESNSSSLHSRTLLLHDRTRNHHNNLSVFMKFKFLRVPNMEYGICFIEFPKKIISLIHLRYLAIQRTSSLLKNIEKL